ncbi:MAG: hypothetical protein ACYC7D_01425 [Nitrososphaerales archaeon]
MTEEETKLMVGCLGYVQATLDDLPFSREMELCKSRMQTVWMLLGDSVPGPFRFESSLLEREPKRAVGHAILVSELGRRYQHTTR